MHPTLPTAFFLNKKKKALLNACLMFALGFTSGLPLLLTSSTLSFWLKMEGVSLTYIGLFGMSTLPYCLKFLWAPFVEQWKVPFLSRFLGHRRSWLLITQIGVIGTLWLIGLYNPQEHLMRLGGLALLLSFCAATQDMVILAYQADVLEKRGVGMAEAITIFGYRMGMLSSGAGALYLNGHHISWGEIYQTMAILMFCGILTTFLMKEPPSYTLNKHMSTHHSLYVIIQFRIIEPFKNFAKRKGWVPILILMMHYKLGDNLIGSLSNIFYHDLGFSVQDIANASKIFGMWTTIAGGIFGGILITHFGLLRSLFWFALLHGLSTLMYIYMIHVGQDIYALYSAIAIENITGGMRTTALLSFRFVFVNRFYTVTHMALLTSFIHLGRFLYATPSGAIVEIIGWQSFFYGVTFATIPILILVVWVKNSENL